MKRQLAASTTTFIYTKGSQVPLDAVHVIVDPSVSAIEVSAFFGRRRLTSIDLPASVITIKSWSFDGCISLSSVRLPNSLENIKRYAFNGCTSLVSIHLPESLSIISDNTFCNCTSLSSVCLPDSLSTISANAFYNCTSLTTIRLPDSLSAISPHAFRGCTALNTIEAPLFPTTTIDPDNLRESLEEANYHPHRLANVIDGKLHHYGLYYNWKGCAKIKDKLGRLPLIIAAERSLKWSHWLQKIFIANMPAIELTDPVTALKPFMLASVGIDSDLEAVYRLLREYPAAIGQSMESPQM